ncbi:MAG: ABC transporter permease, partial [SAR202 cluster bacterium]|nr:ABC transporter permease [SAR202 cluster bacterium]
MFRAISRKVRADITSRPLQTAIVFLALVGASLVLTLAAMVTRGINNPWERLFDEVNGAHVWFNTMLAAAPSAPLSDLEPIGNIEGVSGTAGPYAVTPAGYAVLPGTQPFTIIGMPSEMPEVGAVSIVHGRWLNAGAVTEIVLDVFLARGLGYSIGDEVEIDTVDGFHTMTLVGTVMDPGAPGFATGYVLPTTLRLMFPSRQLDSRFGVRLEHPGRSGEFAELARSILLTQSPVRFTDWHWVKQSADDETQVIRVFLVVFGSFALAASVFILLYTVEANVLSRFREVGLLKAIGFTTVQVTAVFMASQLI